MSSIPTIVPINQVQIRQPAKATPWVRALVERLMFAVRAGSHLATPPFVTDFQPQLGDAVLHGRYGFGVVTAHWPDGRLQVRFDSMERNRLIWPTYLTWLDWEGR